MHILGLNREATCFYLFDLRQVRFSCFFWFLLLSKTIKGKIRSLHLSKMLDKKILTQMYELQFSSTALLDVCADGTSRLRESVRLQFYFTRDLENPAESTIIFISRFHFLLCCAKCARVYLFYFAFGK